MSINKLTAKFCEHASAGTHWDGEGLYLLVKKDGVKYWHMETSFAGRKKLLSFGNYKKVSLNEAREKKKRECQFKIYLEVVAETPYLQ